MGVSTLRRGVVAFLLSPLTDLAAGLEPLVRSHERTSLLIAAAAALAAGWWIQVPVHELLHVLGCVAMGGTVTELQIAPVYGGGWLGRVLPFVVPGGDYAGRLTGFDTHGSDLAYLLTDFSPYVLTIALGVPMLRACGSRPRPILFGAGTVLAMAPFCSLTGDYYEMGSILVTGAWGLALGRGGHPIPDAIRSDDLLRLIGDLASGGQAAAAVRGLGGGAVFGLIVVSFCVGAFLGFATYGAGAWVSTLMRRRGSRDG